MAEKFKVYEALARAFVEEGTSDVFGLMGDGNMLWMAAMGKTDGVTLFHARHENAAVGMADAYAQRSGDVGVCSVTCGPGITQIPTSLTSSVRQGTPMVIFAGDTPRGAGFHLQQFDPGPLVAATGARHVRLRDGAHAPDDVQMAFYIARTERTPVVLTAPYDIQEQDYAWEWAYTPSTQLVVKRRRMFPDPAAIEEVAQLLVEAKNPVILAGRGAVAADARELLRQLAEQSGALLATSLLGKGFFDGDPFNMGLAGAFAHTKARELFVNADLVVGFGAGMGYFTTEGGYLFPSAHLVQVDVSPQGMKEAVPVAETHVQGDAAVVAEGLLATLKEKGHSVVGWRTDEVRERLSDTALKEPPIDLAPGTIDPRHAFEAVNEAIPDDWVVIIGGGHFWNFAVQYIKGRRPEDYLFTVIDFGVIGQGIAAAIGAAVAQPDRKIVLIEGDGSLLMNIQELETLARHGIDVLTVVINDGAYGAEVHKLESMGVDGSDSIFGAPDLAGIARAFGINGERVDASQSDAAAAVRRAIDTPGASVVDIHVSPTVRSAQYRRLFFGEEV